MIRFTFILIALLIGFACINNGYAADTEGDCAKGREWCQKGDRQCRPDHQGRCGKRKGDWYGVRRKVNSTEDARNLFTVYFAGQNVTISDIYEKPWYFEADIKNQSGAIIDRVIVDKRSGRIRSIY